MDAVLKIGGSLTKYPSDLKKLGQKINEMVKIFDLLVLPGGGEFANTVRNFDKKFKVSDQIAHKMAILSMDQYGLFLSEIFKNSYVFYSLDEIKNHTIPIFLPSRFMFNENPLENSWDVTSDSISAYIASEIKAKKIILIKDVDGIFLQDPKQKFDSQIITELSVQELLELKIKTCIDKFLPNILIKKKVDCYIVNGRYPERIYNILANKKTVCTHIVC
jgi:aspartokinase-like uncharacterized kinase